MKIKPKIAIVRGKFLNAYEMQSFEPLVESFDQTAFGSLTSYHDKFTFPVIKLPCPLDLPNFAYKMQLLNRLFIDAHYLWGLEERLRNFDLVHTAETYYHYTQQSLNAKKKGYVKKVIATVLENIPYNNEGIWGRKAFKKRSREELDHIIALTNKTKQALIMEGADPKKITVIGHGIDTSKFIPVKTINKSNNLTILFVGRLEEYKGVYEILEAVKELINDPKLSIYNLKFVLVGNGSEKDKLLKLEKELGIDKIIIHKQVPYDQMPLEYQKADIFVAPSKAQIGRNGKITWEEQYCTTLLEAQAAGLPIVTTNSGGIPENVGEAALLVQPGNVETLTEALKAFILNPSLRQKYGQLSRKRAVEIHDIKKIANRISDIYEKVLVS